MIHFKNMDDQSKYNGLDFRLKFLLDVLCWRAEAEEDADVTITDIDTPDIHLEGGPHYRRQAVDISVRPVGLEFMEEFGRWVNRFFDYGRGYRVALVGALDPSGRHNDHLHLQVPPPYLADGRLKLWETSLR